MQTNPVLGLPQSLLVNELETSVIGKVTAPGVGGGVGIKLDKTSLQSWDWPAGNIVDYLQPPSSSPLQRLFCLTDIKQNAPLLGNGCSAADRAFPSSCPTNSLCQCISLSTPIAEEEKRLRRCCQGLFLCQERGRELIQRPQDTLGR